MKYILMVLLCGLSSTSFGYANNHVTVSGVLVGFDKNNLIIESGAKKTKLKFERKYAPRLEGYIPGTAQIELRVPASALLAQIQNK